MAIPSRRQRRSSIDIWPGFVDALSQLVMVIVFVLLVFTAGQFYLTDALSGRDQALQRLSQQISQLSDLLALERKANADLRLNVAQLSSQLQAVDAQRDQLTNQADQATADAKQQIAERDAKLSQAQTTIDQLNQNILALRQQLQQLAA